MEGRVTETTYCDIAENFKEDKEALLEVDFSVGKAMKRYMRLLTAFRCLISSL